MLYCFLSLFVEFCRNNFPRNRKKPPRIFMESISILFRHGVDRDKWFMLKGEIAVG